ncbi:MAG TPA: hypothetical protein VHS31_06195 [Tepidisphaeraceae bacterium]|nr:hypothetical protein [Tepidisphaeraceae bacterium]
MTAIELRADQSDRGKSLHHFWSVCVGAGRANEGLRASWLEHLKFVNEKCGFQYLRFHGLFHDDMFIYRETDGQPVYNFQYVDDLFDRMLEIGVKPFVELGFCPGDLASQKKTIFWWEGHGSPPRDYSRWAELVTRTIRHWLDRYGIDEVRSWYFEVWNEPNLNPFFRGTRSQYFELYKVSAKAIKSIDPALRVGGPSTSNFVPDARFDGETEDISQHATVLQTSDLDALDWRPVWLTQFLEFCHREHLPVDFVSCHPYPTDWALDALGQTVKQTRSVNATRKDLATVRQMIDASPFPHAEIHLTEWSSSPSPRDHTHDCLDAATFIVKANLESIGLVDSLSYWTFTDVFEENGAGDTIFHGGFGMMNYQGIVKPAFHAYRFLHALGDELLARCPGAVVTRHSNSGRMTALVYHYPDEMTKAPPLCNTRDAALQALATGSAKAIKLILSGLKPGAKVLVEMLDQQHGNALAAWKSIASPETPTRQQTHQLREAAMTTKQVSLIADDLGVLDIEQSIDPWSVLLIDEVENVAER